MKPSPEYSFCTIARTPGQKGKLLNPFGFCTRDAFTVVESYTQVTPKPHILSFSELDADGRGALLQLPNWAKRGSDEEFRLEGF